MQTRAAGFVLTLGSLLGVAAACEGGAPSGVVDRCNQAVGLPPSVATDILFVIDDSLSMAEEQAKVAAQLQTFVQTLADSPVENDFQVAVVTTSITVSGGTCDGTPTQLIDYPDESGRLQLGKDLGGNPLPESKRKILRYDEPDLLEQFALLVQQGTAGGGQEMGLEAMRLALSEPLVSTALDASPPGNEGFLRPGSRLLVVIVSDEDDCSDPSETALVLAGGTCGPECQDDSECSGDGIYCLFLDDPTLRHCETNVCETSAGRQKLEPVQTFVDFLQDMDDGTKTGRKRDVSLAVIGAVDTDGNPARCTSTTDEAQGVATRYVEAVQLMGDHGLVDSICRDSYAETLQKVAGLVSAPQIIELPSEPPDPSLVRVRIHRSKTTDPIDCQNGDGFTFEPAVGDAPARIVMEGRCRLLSSDTLDVRFVCAS